MISSAHRVCPSTKLKTAKYLSWSTDHELLNWLQSRRFYTLETRGTGERAVSRSGWQCCDFPVLA